MDRWAVSLIVFLLVALPVGADSPAVGTSSQVVPAAGWAVGVSPNFADDIPNLRGVGFHVTPSDTRPDMLPPVNPTTPPPATRPVLQPRPEQTGYPFDPLPVHLRRPREPIVHAEHWLRGDWLLWAFRDAPVPPLIVTGDPNLPNPGIPGGGNIIPLVGPTSDYGMLNGARLTLGRWFDPDGELGLEITGLIFGREGTATFFQGSPNRPLSVPILSDTGTPGVYDFAFPNTFDGSLGVRTAIQLLSAEGMFLHRWYGDGCRSFDGMIGYRYLWLNESLELLGRSVSVGGVSTFLGQSLPGGVTLLTTDRFRAKSEFHGLQLGGRWESRHDILTLTAFGKGGLGINLHTLRVEGNTVATGFGVTRTQVGGIRALPSNFGRDTNTDFSLIAETGIELGIQATKSLSLRVGYNLLFWSDVLRPGTVISDVTTLSQVPIDPSFAAHRIPNARPVTVFRASDFLAHGLVLGMVVDW
ncbi:MAG: BBP7 family outer membrane beta-barrel protein [Gemmataceae bacterium]|nr:BBP7 family outer membrane beta-barrel protein [Gemmata sp.]MDW8197528.1 BBP7 family outer membrane beta-barrel protein [Gemmataceae bacterium]